MNGHRRDVTFSALRCVDPRTVLLHSWLKSMMIGIFVIRLKASIVAEGNHRSRSTLRPFGPEFLDPARNPEFLEGLKAEGLSTG
jgi:hypothetical protein